ncbi:SDR family NAD(P)-dependent oxidoreductase [Adlercreutzia sp. ZJ138]|uniref:SDR family NAD(P)-dependent oxidoreductase n=1 Tax=Adlercreutzia sp. ZJ138 TaxID=2709405 RepID=UPI0013ED37AC|nr:SDR family NAD(P)-dependent oxidoreductase [Adlercreutzia sp. ZJ138]
MKILEGQVALITGARRGIGKATIESFARMGADVWACARSFDSEFEEFCSSLSSEWGVEVRPLYFDLEDKKQIMASIKEVRKVGQITCLVNCAGIVAESSSFAMTKAESVMRVLDVNLVKQMELTQYALRGMADGGSIVNLSSIAAAGGMPGQYAYACSKNAVEIWTKMLAQELGVRSIRVNAVAPGFVDTDMGNQAAGDLLDRILDSTVMKRMAKPQEIADVIAAISSNLFSYMTGQTVYVDGGGASRNG